MNRLISFSFLLMFLLISSQTGYATRENSPVTESVVYRVRIEMTSLREVITARKLGLSGAIAGRNTYEIPPDLYKRLKQSGIKATITGGISELTVKQGEQAGLPLPEKNMSSISPADGEIYLDSGDVFMIIPDWTDETVYYSMTASGAPIGSVVTGVEYSTLIEPDYYGSFWCGDYLLALWKDYPDFEYIFWEFWGDWMTGTDDHLDSDPENDWDIDIDRWHTDYFNGRDPNGEWGIMCYDAFWGESGWMRYLRLRIFWEGGETGDPVIRLEPSGLLFDLPPEETMTTGAIHPDNESESFISQKAEIQKFLSFNPDSEYGPDRIIVRFKPGLQPEGFANGVYTRTNNPSINNLLSTHGTGPFKKLFRNPAKTPDLNVYIIPIPVGSKMDEVLREFNSHPDVLYAEPDYKRKLYAVPTDSSYPQQWGFQNIQAEAAWDIQTGDPSVSIAIIDTGVDWDHPDLADNIWINTGEIPGNGIDDDGNGFIDDVRGWDFALQRNDPMDVHGHGSHCAGIAAAVTNNTKSGQNVAGTAWNSKIMALRAGDEDGFWDTDIALAIEYAVNNGAKVISMSLGGPDGTMTLKTACDAAYNSGVLVVAAAGNEYSQAYSYPGAYESVMAVVATDGADRKADFSNYGNWVEICAPGVNILSTVWNDTYDTWSGTSMATPFVAGAGALLFSQKPTLTNIEVRQILKDNADNIDAQNPSYVGRLGSGRLNLYRALNDITGQDKPSQSVTVHNDGTATLRVTDITLKHGKTWLYRVTPTNMNISPGGSSLVTVTVDPAGLPTGFTDTETLVFHSNDLLTPLKELNVTISIGATGFTFTDIHRGPGAGNATLKFQSRATGKYDIYFSDSSFGVSMNWNLVESGVDGTGGILSWTDDGSHTGSTPLASRERYYRIIDTSTNTWSADIVGIFVIHCETGRNLITTPLIPYNITLDTVIGDQLTGGNVKFFSDTVEKWEPATTKYVTSYFDYSTASWRDWDNAGAPKFGIESDNGYWINILAFHQPKDIMLTGKVSTQAREIAIDRGRNLCGLAYPVEIPLQSSGLIESGLTGNNLSFFSDYLEWWNNSTSNYEPVYFNPVDGTWKNMRDMTASSRKFKPGEGFWVNVLMFNPPFVWTCPMPY